MKKQARRNHSVSRDGVKQPARRTLSGSIISLVLAVAIVYVIVAVSVFQFRHSWMTQVEAFMHIPQALTFQSVDYETVRIRKK